MSETTEVIITYKGCDGIPDRFEISGDFDMGREKTGDGPVFLIHTAEGKEYRIKECPLTVSRITKRETGGCSSCHARFFWAEGKLFIQDMGSTNGTKINGKMIEGWEKKRESRPVVLSEKSSVTLGEVEFEVEPIVKEEPEEVPVAKPPAPPHPSSPVNLDDLMKGSIHGNVNIYINSHQSNINDHSQHSIKDNVLNRSSIGGKDNNHSQHSIKDNVLNRSSIGEKEGSGQKKKKGPLDEDEEILE